MSDFLLPVHSGGRPNNIILPYIRLPALDSPARKQDELSPQSAPFHHTEFTEKLISRFHDFNRFLCLLFI